MEARVARLSPQPGGAGQRADPAAQLQAGRGEHDAQALWRGGVPRVSALRARDPAAQVRPDYIKSFTSSDFFTLSSKKSKYIRKKTGKKKKKIKQKNQTKKSNKTKEIRKEFEKNSKRIEIK
jgi:hypothetical protein